MRKLKIGTMMFTWNGVGDRFLKQYFEPQRPAQIFPQIAGSVIQGVELQHPNHVNAENMEETKALLAQYGLQPIIVNTPMASDDRWKRGSFSHPDVAVRAAAVERVKQSIDACRALGCGQISMFLGQDGFDYPMVSDYRRVWGWLVECFREVGQYAGEIKIAIEYKPREPRTKQYLDSAAKTLLLAEETGCGNIGLLVDIGHAWMAGENMGETICLAAHKNRLFHVHLNDNSGYADDDLGIACLNFVPYLEAIFWLKEVGYEGWTSFDVHSPRENSAEIILASANLWAKLEGLVDKTGMDTLRELVQTNDGSKLLALMADFF